MDNYAVSMCDSSLNGDDRLEMWLCLYFAKWNCFPVKQLDDAANETFSKLKQELLDIANDAVDNPRIDLREFATSVGLIEEGDGLEKAKEVVNKAAQVGYSEAVDIAIRYTVAKGVVESSVRGTSASVVSGALGRRGAIVVLERSATLAGGQAASKAFTALANPVVGISAAVGELAATTLLSAWGVDNPTAVVLAGAGAGILSAAIAGGVVAGPLGAGAGALIGAGSVVVGGTVNAIFNAFEGGYNDNWCYIEVGNLRRNPSKKICAGLYKGNDGWYFKTYQNKYYSSNKKDYFSAGNKQKDHFQVSFWDEWGNNITTYKKVWYRDTFFVSKNGGKLVIVFARGGFNGEAPGKVDVHIHN